MFGLNGDEDKKDDKKTEETSDAALAAPSVSSVPDFGATAVDVGTGPILPTSPVVTPTEPANPLSQPPDVPGPTEAPIEALPTAPKEQSSSGLPMADATMPDDLDLGGVNLENAYIPAEPKSDSKDKRGKKKDDNGDLPSVASMLGGSAPQEDLVKLKTQALQSLAPLVDKLDQTPEEKFKTTMMLIQASDNSELVPEAYKAANAITDEKARAQALLDVVNEINYFTQHDKSESEE